MEQNPNVKKSSNKTLLIIGIIVGVIVLFFVGRAIYIRAVWGQACHSASKAFKQAERDYERALRDFDF